jgi:hypothetical protein
MGEKIEKVADVCAVVANVVSRRRRNPLQTLGPPELLHHEVLFLKLHKHDHRSL